MRYVKIIITISIFLFNIGQIFPQQHPNSLYLEVGGSGGLYSLNYDRMFTPNIGGRIGFSYFSFSSDNFFFPSVTMYMFPISLNYLAGEGSSKFELGAGVTIVTGTADWFGVKGSGSAIAGIFNIGYRYQPPEGGFLFRIGLTPIVSSTGVHPWGGLSIGMAF